jgi:hypothetical protein
MLITISDQDFDGERLACGRGAAAKRPNTNIENNPMHSRMGQSPELRGLVEFC